MQYRFTNGEFRFELKDAMRQCDHRARDGARLGRDRQTIPPGAGQRKCTAHTRQGGKRRQIAVFTFGFAARESSRTSAVNDMQAYAFVLARDRSRWEMLT